MPGLVKAQVSVSSNRWESIQLIRNIRTLLFLFDTLLRCWGFRNKSEEYRLHIAWNLDFGVSANKC